MAACSWALFCQDPVCNILIGFIMVAFTERKQGLHDMICSTLAVKGAREGAVDPTVFD